jgi:hypothetical protein
MSERKLTSHKARELGGATNEDNKWKNFKKLKTQQLAIFLLGFFLSLPQLVMHTHLVVLTMQRLQTISMQFFQLLLVSIFFLHLTEAIQAR